MADTTLMRAMSIALQVAELPRPVAKRSQEKISCHRRCPSAIRRPDKRLLACTQPCLHRATSRTAGGMVPHTGRPDFYLPGCPVHGDNGYVHVLFADKRQGSVLIVVRGGEVLRKSLPRPFGISFRTHDQIDDSGPIDGTYLCPQKISIGIGLINGVEVFPGRVFDELRGDEIGLGPCLSHAIFILQKLSELRQ